MPEPTLDKYLDEARAKRDKERAEVRSIRSKAKDCFDILERAIEYTDIPESITVSDTPPSSPKDPLELGEYGSFEFTSKDHVLTITIMHSDKAYEVRNGFQATYRNRSIIPANLDGALQMLAKFISDHEDD